MEFVAALTLILLLLGVYLFPTLVAFTRGVSDRGTVAVLNIFLGWTFLGWVVSLARACGTVRDEARLPTSPQGTQAN